jgi:hypothetical protein
MNRFHLLVVLFGLAFVASGCGTAPSPTLFRLHIERWADVSGWAYCYDISPRSLDVTYENDFQTPQKWEAHVPLTEEQGQALLDCVRHLPWSQISGTYHNPNWLGGCVMRFCFQELGRPTKYTEIKNIYQADLERLCELVDSMLPKENAKFKIKFSVHMEREKEWSFKDFENDRNKPSLIGPSSRPDSESQPDSSGESIFGR